MAHRGLGGLRRVRRGAVGRHAHPHRRGRRRGPARGLRGLRDRVGRALAVVDRYGETSIGRGSVSLQWALILSGVAASLYLAALGLGIALQLGGRGLQVRERLEVAEADLEVAGVELRIAQERSGIAQEVHDVLAHSLAVVVAVADGSRFLRETRPETTEEALREIAGTARSALLDLRGLTEELTDDAHRPQPGLADLPALIRGMAATGMRVDLRTSGRPGGLTPSQQLSVYRIVQESLTNALKHTRGTATVDVSFVGERPGLALTVRSRGSEPEPEPASTLPPARSREPGADRRARVRDPAADLLTRVAGDVSPPTPAAPARARPRWPARAGPSAA
ncbi:hypothetical protein B5P21_07340 [Clavibacter michiganensis subsp. insidiosus]|nr:hypothetical protein B5P21_07340 [Clavibacter michiganensis subsp. insidiosus]